MLAVLQVINNALILLFGMLALLAWRRLGADGWGKTQAAWLLTGGCFVPVGVYAVVHALAAAAAQRAGSGSGLYRLFVDWSPAGNVGRSAGVAAYALALAALVAGPPRRARARASWGVGVVGAAVVGGSIAAALQRGMSTAAHMTALAVLATATVVALMAALLLGVMNDGLDLLLWLAVAAYTVKETIGVSLMAILAWWDVANRADAALLFCWMSVVAMAGAAALARIRLRRASERQHVPALFERLHALRRPAES